MDFYEKPEDQIWLKYPQLIEFWADFPDMKLSDIEIAKFENAASIEFNYKEIWQFLDLYTRLTQKTIFLSLNNKFSSEEFDIIVNSFEKWESQKVTKAALELIKKECVNLSKTKVLPQVSSKIVISSPGYRPDLHYHHHVMQIVRYVISAYSGMFLESKVVNSVIFQFLVIQKDFEIKPTNPDVIQLEFYEKPEEQIWLKYPQLIEFWVDHSEEILSDSIREEFLKLVAKDLEPLGKEIKDEILKDSLKKRKTQNMDKTVFNCIKSAIVSLVELNKTSLKYFTPEGVRKIAKRLNDKWYQVDRDVSPTCVASIISEVEHNTFKIVAKDDHFEIKTDTLNSIIFQLSVALKKIEDEENTNVNNTNNNNVNNNVISSPSMIQLEFYENPEEKIWLKNPGLVEFWAKYPDATLETIDDLQSKANSDPTHPMLIEFMHVYSTGGYRSEFHKTIYILAKETLKKWQTQKITESFLKTIKQVTASLLEEKPLILSFFTPQAACDIITFNEDDDKICYVTENVSPSCMSIILNKIVSFAVGVDKFGDKFRVKKEILNSIIFQFMVILEKKKSENTNVNNNNVIASSPLLESKSIQIESYKKLEDQVWLENPSHIEFWADYPNITLAELSNLNSEPLSKYHQLVKKEWLKNRISLREMRDLSRQKWQTQKVSKQLLDIIKIETKKYVRTFQVFYDWHADNLLERVTLRDDGFIYDVNETFSIKSIIRNIREYPGFKTISDDLFNKIDVKIFNSILFQLLVCKKQDKLKHSITGSNSNNNSNNNNNINTDVNDNNIVPSVEIEYYEKTEEQKWLENPQLIEFWVDYPDITSETWNSGSVMEMKNQILIRKFIKARNIDGFIETGNLYDLLRNSLKKWETQRVSKTFLDVVKIEVKRYAEGHTIVMGRNKTREDVRKCVSLQGTTCNIIDKEGGFFEIYKILAKIREHRGFETSSSETKVDIFRFNSILFQLLVLQKKLVDENTRVKPFESAMSMLNRFLGPPQGPVTRSMFSSSSVTNPMYVLNEKDLEMVMSQAEISKEKATELLVKNKGNVVNSIMEAVYKDSNIPANDNHFDLACAGCIERGQESTCGLRKARLEELSKEKGKKRLSEMISQLNTFTRNENNNNNNNQDEEMSSDSSDDEFPELVPYDDEAIEKVVEHANTDRTEAIIMLNKHKGDITASIIEIVENNSRNDNNNNNNNVVPVSRREGKPISALMERVANPSILGQSLGKAKYGDSYRNIDPVISWTSEWKITKVLSGMNSDDTITARLKVIEMLNKHHGDCEKAIDELRHLGRWSDIHSIRSFLGPPISSSILGNSSSSSNAMFIVDDTISPLPSKEDNKKRGYPFIEYENPTPIVENKKEENTNNNNNNNDVNDNVHKKEDDSKLCVICIDQPREIVLIPCGHMCYCVTCSELIDKRAQYEEPKVKICPLCRKTITMKTKIYF